MKKILVKVVVPILGTGSTIVELTQDAVYCQWLMAIAVLSFFTCIAFIEKLGKYFWFIIFLPVILFVFSLIGYKRETSFAKQISTWVAYIEAQPASKIDILKRAADNNDGPAQYDLAEYYVEHHQYSLARTYAQKAADNGNSKAHGLLAEIYFHGNGCVPDARQAISNVIMAHQLNRIRYDSWIAEWKEHGLVLTPREEFRLAQCEETYRQVETIIQSMNKAYDESGNNGAIRVLSNHRSKLERMSLEGYLPATELLYVLELSLHNFRSDRIMYLANVLYQANHIPTSPADRVRFFQNFKYKDYSSSRYDEYIADKFYYDLTAPKIDYGLYSPYFYIKQYRLFTEQYNWIYNLAVNSGNRLEYIFSEENKSYDEYVVIAKTLLNNNIKIIQGLMNDE